jgi:hypothetical protein
MTKKVEGTFEVRVQVEPPQSDVEGVVLGRARVEKHFVGALEGKGEVAMLTVQTPDPKRRAYVALERIEGSLEGKRGSFVTMHQGTSDPDGMALAIAIAPGSGTGELAGITGAMRIRIEGGQHFYELDYALA